MNKFHMQSASFEVRSVAGERRLAALFLFPHTLPRLRVNKKELQSKTKVRFVCCDKQPFNSPLEQQPKRKRAKPYGYWTSEKNVLDELRMYVSDATKRSHNKGSEKIRNTGIRSRENDTVDVNGWNTMPTAKELEFSGRSDLAGAIRRHGWARIATAAGLRLSSVARPRSLNLTFCTTLQLRSGRMRPYCYWRDFENVRNEVEDIMQSNGLQALPSARILLSLGRSDLLRAITLHGGWLKVADRLNIPTASQLPWDSLETVLMELRLVASVTGSPHECPSIADIRAHGRRGLLSAIRHHHGGLRAVASHFRNKMAEDVKTANFENVQGAGLESTHVAKASNDKKEDFANDNTNSVNGEHTEDCHRNIHITSKTPDADDSSTNLQNLIRECIRLARHHDIDRPTDVMPTKRELLSLGRADIVNLVQRHGFRKVATECGLRMRRRSRNR